MATRWAARLRGSFCTTGLLLGTLFFAASLTPSLLPRTPLTQGVLSGVSFAAGYAIGVGARWLWAYLELPLPGGRVRRAIQIPAAVICTAIALFFLWRASDWQNSIRVLMELEPVEGTRPLQVALVALAVFAVLLAVGRLFAGTLRLVSRWFDRVVPRRLARVLGFALVVILFWSIANGVLFRAGLRMADSSYQQLDALVEAEIEPPSDPMRSGSPASLVDWEDLGRTGRRFVAATPALEDLRPFSHGEALEPIRVYVGLNSAETPEQRARLALQELQRVGAFERSILILLTPTGTGSIDPGAIATVEHLHGGDVASVAVQYSYLASWLALLTEPGYGAETAQAVFNEVYGHWITLPENERPRLYLHGLSLGALNSDLAADLFDVIGDPFHGALWSGPPFASRTWSAATAGRHPASAEWLPRFRDGSIIRFTNQANALDIPGAQWGPLRIVFLQYASDPITFFRPQILWRRPAWLAPPRGPDVSPDLRWYPVVTFLQLIVDMAAATDAPMGYGHVFAPEHYIDAWREVTDPPGWSDEGIERLKAYFEGRR
jgi:uncharacterized membrane protein